MGGGNPPTITAKKEGFESKTFIPEIKWSATAGMNGLLLPFSSVGTSVDFSTTNRGSEYRPGAFFVPMYRKADPQAAKARDISAFATANWYEIRFKRGAEYMATLAQLSGLPQDKVLEQVSASQEWCEPDLITRLVKLSANPKLPEEKLTAPYSCAEPPVHRALGIYPPRNGGKLQ